MHPPGASIRDAVGSTRFRRLYAACLICSLGVFVPFVHLIPYALDHGVTPSSAVLLLGMIGVGSTAGRFFLGGLADRMGRRPTLLAMFAGMALAMIIWGFAAGVWSLAVFAFTYGVFYGGWVAVLPAVVMDAFGGRNVSGLIGILYTSVAFGTLAGPSAAGFAFDFGHSYTLAIVGGVCANIDRRGASLDSRRGHADRRARWLHSDARRRKPPRPSDSITAGLRRSAGDALTQPWRTWSRVPGALRKFHRGWRVPPAHPAADVLTPDAMASVDLGKGRHEKRRNGSSQARRRFLPDEEGA